MARLSLWPHRALAVWDAVQVELHGQYSIQRLESLCQYIGRTSLLHAAFILIVTPLPCLCVILGLDALPLVPPREGASKQTIGFWLRSYYVSWSIIYFSTLQVGQMIPSLAMTQRRLWLISLAISGMLMGTMKLEILAIGFPVPFVFQVQTLPFMILVGTAWWLSWKHTLRSDPLVKADFDRFLKLFNTSSSMLVVYVAYNVVYTQLHGPSKILFALLLPVLKMFLKFRFSRRVYYWEDVAPVHVVSSVDVFHTLFVSLTMQQTPTSTLTLAMFMTVDVVQGVIAAYEVLQVVKRLDELRPRLGCNEPSATAGTRDAISILQGAHVRDVVRIVETNERVRHHPSVALPRHVRDVVTPRDSALISSSRVYGSPRGSNPTSIWPAETVKRGKSIQLLDRELLACSHSQPPAPTSLSDSDLAQLEYTQKSLKLLHMVEFYILIEYVEVMFAALYAVYVIALSNMPSRVYYAQLATLSDEQMQVAAAQVSHYAVLELASLVVFIAVLRWQIKGFSPVQQLAFALQNHWMLVQADYMIALILTGQLSLEHNGTDFTFQFKWLHEQKTGPSW